MYTITAQVIVNRDGWTSSRQVPTFLLDENIQGIYDPVHATRVAANVLAQAAVGCTGIELSITAGEPGDPDGYASRRYSVAPDGSVTTKSERIGGAYA